jgi:hypothetical protein
MRARTVEASMHGSIGRSGKTDDNPTWNIGFFALPVLLVVALIGLAITQPAASNWISEAVRAEFAGIDLPAVAPTQLAQPAMQIRTVRAN